MDHFGTLPLLSTKLHLSGEKGCLSGKQPQPQPDVCNESVHSSFPVIVTEKKLA